MPLTTKLLVDLDADYTSALDLSTTENRLRYVKQFALATGTAAGQADKVWSDTRTLTASASEDLDLTGTLVDAFGATITMARVKGLIVFAAAANTNNVVVGGASSNGWTGPFGAATHTLAVRPGGLLTLFATDATAYGVTAGTGDLLHVANSGAGSSVTYDVVVIGASA
jgi:hypothetical protein